MPQLSEECRELVVRMARENSRWGYFRIRGELLKLGYTVSATTIRSILRRTQIPPAGRRSERTWKQFLAAHVETLARHEMTVSMKNSPPSATNFSPPA